MRWTVAAALLALGSPAVAQGDQDFDPNDPMSVQRCVWRCQYEFGADSAEYPACIASQCEGPARGLDGAQSTAPRVGGGAWAFVLHPSFGPAAYVTSGGAAISVACGGGANVTVRVDLPGTTADSLTFSTTGVEDGSILRAIGAGSYAATEQACFMGIEGLRSGSAVVLGPSGVTLPLRGSSAAIERVLAACPAVLADIANDCGI